jgi:hypothetical protein
MRIAHQVVPIPGLSVQLSVAVATRPDPEYNVIERSLRALSFAGVEPVG